MVRRLSANEIAWARDQRVKQLLMWSIIREVASYFAFLVLIYVCAYSNMSDNSFLEVKHLQRYFLQPNRFGRDFSQVSLDVREKH